MAGIADYAAGPVRDGKITAVRLVLSALDGDEFTGTVDLPVLDALVFMLLEAMRHAGLALGILTEEQKQLFRDAQWPIDPGDWPGPHPDGYVRAELDRALLLVMEPGD